MTKKPEDQVSLGFLRFSIGILFALEASLALLYYLLPIPEPTFIFIAIVMGLTATFSLSLVYSAFRLGWISQIKRLRWTILGGYSFSMLIVVAVIAIITNRVFTNLPDVLLTATLLFFGSGIFVSFGYVLTHDLSNRLNALNQASREIARGNLNERVSLTGRDEIAELGATFNEMASQLQVLDNRQKELRRIRNDMIAWIGHDLRTPLTSIRAMLEALSDRVVEDPDTTQRYLEMAQKEIKNLSRLIDDLFDLAKMDSDGLSLDRQDVALPDLISDTLESFFTLAKQNHIELTGSVEPGIDLVYIDAQLINRVLNNLTSNAVRYTPAGGIVRIEAVRSGNKVIVSVIDNGKGMKPEDMANIFERFYRGDKSRNRSTGGSGLGLAISRGIIEAHGEHITAVSKLGQGTTVSFTIPESNLPS